MKKNVYTINGKRVVQGDNNILNEHEINVNNLTEIWYYRFPKGILQDALSDACLEAYLINSACIVRGEYAEEGMTNLILMPLSALFQSDEDYEKNIKEVDGLMVAADMPLGGLPIPVSYRELPKFFAENVGNFLPEKLKQYICSKEDFYRIHSN